MKKHLLALNLVVLAVSALAGVGIANAGKVDFNVKSIIQADTKAMCTYVCTNSDVNGQCVRWVESCY